jgi:hypothetical protein
MDNDLSGQPGAAPMGPDFSGPEDRVAPSPVAPATPAAGPPQYAEAAPPPLTTPDFVVPEPALAPVEQPAAAPTSAAAPVRRGSPWPSRITAALVVLSVLAIAAAIILPRQRTQVRAHVGGASSETETPSQAGGATPGATTGDQGASQAGQATAQAAGWGPGAQGPAGPAADTQGASATDQGAAQDSGAGAGTQGEAGGETGATGAGPREGQGGSGAGSQACGNCGGTGTVACPMKHLPNGHLLNPWFWNEPRYYSGDDPLLPDEADLGVCPLCGGSYKARCPRCEGAGKIDPNAPPPAGFDAKGLGGFDMSALQGIASGLMGGQ